jgi:threonine dehydratase
MTPSRLRLKAESLHQTGAFKLRGAFNSILSLGESERLRGIIAYSSGNHAQAVAYAANVLGVQAVLVMPETTPKFKIEGTLRWGARVVIEGKSSEELAAIASALAQQHGYAAIHPFDSDAILTATGVIGLEILRQAPDVEVVTAPLGGGGLMAGLAAALKLSKPSVKIIGVEPELSADAYQSFKTGRLVELPAEEVARTVADGLRVQRLGSLNWRHIQAYVDDIITVSEQEICQAVRAIALEARLVAEPSGAVAPAGALKFGTDQSRTLAILSGGNVDLVTLAAILRHEPV